MPWKPYTNAQGHVLKTDISVTSTSQAVAINPVVGLLKLTWTSGSDGAYCFGDSGQVATMNDSIMPAGSGRETIIQVPSSSVYLAVICAGTGTLRVEQGQIV